MATTSYGTPYVQSSDLVSGWPTASLNVADRIDAVSYAGNGLNAQTGTTYTLVVGDAGKTVTLNNAAAVAVTLPQDSTANLPTGAVVHFYNLGSGTVTISAGAGATLQGGSLTAAQYGYAAVIKLSANTYGPFEAVPTSPGLAIVTPTSTANSGGTVTVTGANVSFSAVSSVSLNGIFSSTYTHYRVLINATNVSATNTSYLRLRASGTDLATSYYWTMLYGDFGSATGGYTNGANVNQISEFNYASNSETWAWVEFTAPNLAQKTGFTASGPFAATNGNFRNGGGYVNNTNAYDGLSLIAVSGTLSGTIRAYGYRNS